MSHKPVIVALWGFEKHEGAIERLAQSGAINVAFSIGGSFGGVTGLDPYALHALSDRDFQPEYLIPPDLYARLFAGHFSRFFADVGRTDAYFGSHTDYHRARALFRQLSRFFYDALLRHKVELVLFSTFNHEMVDTVLGALAQELGLRTIFAVSPMMYQGAEQVFFIHERIEERGYFKGKAQRNDISFDWSEIVFGGAKFVKSHKISNFKQDLLLNRRILKGDHSHIRHNQALTAEYEETLMKVTAKDFDVTQHRFVYFPLHYQPELSTIGLGPQVFDDQTIAIEWLSNAVPDDVYIVVKENPIQTFYWRDPLFFQRLSDLDNVIVAPIDIPSQRLIDYSLFVATITGTAGWEALFSKKPVVCFGYALYQNLPGAFAFCDDLDLQNVIDHVVDVDSVKKSASELFATAWPGSISSEFFPAPNEYDNQCRLIANGLHSYMSEQGFFEPDAFADSQQTMDQLRKTTRRKAFAGARAGYEKPQSQQFNAKMARVDFNGKLKAGHLKNRSWLERCFHALGQDLKAKARILLPKQAYDSVRAWNRKRRGKPLK